MGLWLWLWLRVVGMGNNPKDEKRRDQAADWHDFCLGMLVRKGETETESGGLLGLCCVGGGCERMRKYVAP